MFTSRPFALTLAPAIATHAGSAGSPAPAAQRRGRAPRERGTRRVSGRRHPHRGIGGTRPVPPGADRPTPVTTYDLRALRVHSDT